MDTISYNDKQGLKELFIGKQIVETRAEEGILILSDGKELSIKPNSGCWGCISGNFSLSELNEVNNVITNVKTVKTDKDGTTYQLFLYVEGVKKKEKLFAVTGSEGNGYYGTGYTIEVTE